MHHPLPRFAGILLAICWAIALTPDSRAQSPAPYHGFQRFDPGSDNEFPIGVHGGRSRVKFLKDTLHIDFTQLYGQECNLAHLDSATWHGLAFPDSVTHAQDRDFYRAAYQETLKVVTSPCSIAELFDDCVAIENYYGWNVDTVDAVGFTDPGYLSPGGVWRSDSTFFATIASYDTVPNRRFFGATLLTLYHGDTLMAGGSKHTYSGIHGAQNWNSRISKPDSSGYFDVMLTLKADPIITRSEYSDDTVIAYALLYRRDTSGQWRNDTISDCGCNFYYPMRKYAITKSLYLNEDSSRFDPVSGYKEFTYTFRFLDTVRGFGTPLVVQHWSSSAMDTIYRAGAGTGRYNPVGKTPLPNGSGSDTLTKCGIYCQRLLAALKAQQILPPDAINRDAAVEGSDFYVDIHTTRVVPVTFLKATVGNHVVSAVRNGVLDGVVQAAVDSVFNDNTVSGSRQMALNPILWRFGIRDEPNLERFLSYRLLASKVQRAILARDTSDRRGIWCNPIGHTSSLRAYSGDLDSTDIKMVHMVASQEYNIGGAIPIFYANLDSMSPSVSSSFYLASRRDTVIGADTLRARYTMGNSGPDYNFYTKKTQASLTTKLTQTLEAIDVARVRFSRLGAAPYPVYYVAQVQGKFADSTHFDVDWRPTTPEEISVQPWLALSCGVDGLVFSDFQYSFPEFGVMHGGFDSATLSRYHDKEYDSLLSGDPRDAGLPGLPRMWLGFRSRLAAVRGITDAFHDRILPVYKLLKRTPSRISLADTTRSLTAIPLIDSVLARQAQRYTWPFADSTAYDARAQTHMDIAVFEPGDHLPADTAAGARYLLVVNRRCWPVDSMTYSSSSASQLDQVSRWDTLAGIHHGTHGFGNIDVRRPVIVLKQNTGTLVDSFRVTKVGDTSWSMTVVPGARLQLDWLRPGGGEMYKITPIRSGLSPLGTAYNNAVRSVSLSDAARKQQVVVYERDSIIYAMTMDSSGRWSKELRISDTSDATDSTRAAWNMFPSVSPVRNGTAWLFVWERRNPATGKTSVEGRYWPRLPHPDSLTISRRLIAIAAPRTISGSYRMTPSVTGIDSGFVIAWATPARGIEAVAVPDIPLVGTSDISAPIQLKATQDFNRHLLDSLCQYPTLAYVRNYDGIGHVTHCAWQQQFSVGEDIFYQRIRARFPAGSAAVITTLGMQEEVSRSLPGCHFRHPSIASDSVRTGVAFEALLPYYRGKSTRALAGGISVIYLRFRDTTTAKAAWNTPSYSWGDDSSLYERPSLIEFPMAPRASLIGTGGKPEGGLAWFRSKGSTSVASSDQVYLYRFGGAATSRAAQGRHPSMTLVPFRATAPYMDRSSLFYRDAEARSFIHTPAYTSGNGSYMDGLLLNHPSRPDTNFTAIAGNSLRVFMSKSLRLTLIARFPAIGACGLPTFSGALIPIASLNPDRIYPDTGITLDPTLPPTFFAPPDSGRTLMETLDDGSDISRTSIFSTSGAPVLIRRLVIGSEFLVDWLDGQPYDSAGGSPANLRSYLELVRNSDGVVLWRGDTITARSVADSSFDDKVEIPSHMVAPPGTAVYIRLRVQPTTGIIDTTYDISAGFYNELDSTDPGFLKLIRSRRAPASTESGARVEISVAPNPTAGPMEVKLNIPFSGFMRINIYDMLGTKIKELPRQSIPTAGEYVVPLDVSGIPNGIYTLQVEIGGLRNSARISVSR